MSSTRYWRLATAAVLILLWGLALLNTPEKKGGGWGSTGLDFGYEPDPQGAKAFAESLPALSFAAAAPDAMQKAEHVDTFLHRAMDKAHRARYGKPFSPERQGIGDCVSWGAANAVFCAEAVEWELGNRDEPPIVPSTEVLYGGSRVEARGKPGDGSKPVGGWSDGSTGYAAAKWLRDWGVVYREQYRLKKKGGVGVEVLDLRDYSSDRAKLFGAYGAGGKGDEGRVDAIAKQTPCSHVVNVKTWDEVAAAITSGFPVTIASSQGFNKTRDSDGFCRPQGTWRHQMCLVSIRFGDRPGALCVNSWGDYCDGGKFPDDQPDGSFWIDKATVERIIQQGDSWAIGETAFRWRDIRHDNWLGTEP